MEVVDMAGRRIDPLDKDNAVRLYLSGKTITEAASLAGIGHNTLAAELRSRGIKARNRLIRDDIVADEVTQRYIAGESEYALAATYDCSRNVIRRLLRQQNVAMRGCSAAGVVRVGRMTPEERAAQAAAAHEAVRGRTCSFEERCRSAKGRERNPVPMSDHEAAFAAWLTERNVPYRREVAVGPYNVDFAVGSVAVEVLGGEWHASKAIHARRTPYILGQGWALAFVWAVPNHPLTAQAAEEVVAYANLVSRNPTLLGQYRVIRGDGHTITIGRCDDGQFAGIPPARYGEDVAG
jgi:very-short-patch-repair endonuclease/predicted HTH domain antitoxin